MSALVFLDTETTGLSLDDDIWEFAAIRREEDGQETIYHLFIEHDQAKADALPDSFRIDHDRRYQPEAAVSRLKAAGIISGLMLGRPHVVGAVPNFDTERIARLLAEFSLAPTWHHHLIDVENLAVGYLVARGAHVSLPWDSDAISSAVGVEPPTDERHTAMGDTRWVMELFDAISGTWPARRVA